MKYDVYGDVNIFIMKDLTVNEFEEILQETDYKIDPDELRNLVSRLYKHTGDRIHLLKNLVQCIENINYKPTIEEDDDFDPILDVYMNFCGLKFIVNSSLDLVLIEEMWYDRGCTYEACNIIVGKPDEKTISKIINLYATSGRGASKINPSIEMLIQQQKIIQ